ncbi:MAG TPA: heparan-alpha-glucosaminide N-acetyltransferase domain-containing protein [Acidobacteriaceae bacterium]|jgi:predicted acyltransferase|nr:heparan-alpha-glucosaminide N-acetyltransferase domain-containing protein [Acidobacteriaceae bacterium]
MLKAAHQEVLSPALTANRAVASTPAVSAPRLLSLDVMRGATIAAMILVTDPGTYSAVFPPLLHAAWQGATPTDMIFPAFLFMVGVSTVFSIQGRLQRGTTRGRLVAHILLRSVVLIVLGLLVNGFPFYDLHHLRIPGILQRIALCYATSALLYLAMIRPAGEDATLATGARSRSTRTAGELAALIAVILIGYWALLRYFPVPGFGPARYDSVGYLGAYIDRAVFTTRHLWAWGLTPGYGVTYDPEGLLSTLPAIANTLLGVLTGVWLRMPRPARSKAADLLYFGAMLFLVAWPLSSLMPINKRIWTSTFSLLSGGVSLLVLGILYWLLDLRSASRWVRPAIDFLCIFGTNAISAFVLSSFITATLDAIHLDVAGAAISLHQAAHQYLFASWLPPRIGSLTHALAIVVLNAGLLYPLYRKHIFLRI